MPKIELNIGTANGVQVGDNNVQNNQFAKDDSPKLFFAKLREAAPPEAEPVIQELEQLAMETPEPEQQSAWEQRLSGAMARLQEFLPVITKAAVAGANGYLQTYASTSPTIQAIVAALQAIQST